MIIRKAEKNDISVILDLITKLAIHENSVNKLKLSEDDLYNYMFGNSPILFAIIAEDNNEAIGIAMYYYRISTWVGKSVHLEDLYVDEKARGKGVGKKLFKKLLSISKETNAKRMEWEVSRNNSEGAKFYESQGAYFDENWRIYRLDLY